MPGSPFRTIVVDPTAVRLIGGWAQYLDESARIKLPAKLAFDVNNAGPGNLECKVAGRKITPEKSGNRIRFEITTEGLNSGEHDFDIKFANISIPEIPKLVISTGDQVVLTGKGLSQAQCGESSVFNIDGSKAGAGMALMLTL